MNFRPDTTPDSIAAARRNCGGLPGLAPAARARRARPGRPPSALRYDVSHASRPTWPGCSSACWRASPQSVLGVSLKDPAAARASARASRLRT